MNLDTFQVSADDAAMPKTAPHPGARLWADFLEPLNVTVGEAAAALGVSRKHLSAIINGRSAITPDMSARLGKALNQAADYWVRRQLEHDMAQIKRRRLAVKRLVK